VDVDVLFLRTRFAIEKHRHEDHDQQHQYNRADQASAGFLLELQLFLGDGCFGHVG
jgi:hypothetical protein